MISVPQGPILDRIYSGHRGHITGSLHWTEYTQGHRYDMPQPLHWMGITHGHKGDKPHTTFFGQGTGTLCAGL